MDKSFVVEIGVEEIPSQYLPLIRDAFIQSVEAALREGRIAIQEIRGDATPRRLVVWGNVGASQEAVTEVVKGPSVTHAYREGEPTPALLGFCRRTGSQPEDCEIVGDGPKAYVTARVTQPVATLEEVLPGVMGKAFSAIPSPRNMRWGPYDYRFIRPVRWTLLFVDHTMVPLTIFNVGSSHITYGNRTDHPEAMEVSGTRHYFDVLRQGKVLLDSGERARIIMERGRTLAQTLAGEMVFDADLLQEVRDLVEWPEPFLGRFSEEFLAIPAPILMTSMKVHQRYFPIRNAAGGLLNAFIGVRNGEGRQMDLVVRGNQKVLQARLADAAYFYRQDHNARLEDHIDALDRVIFHAKLGSYGDKIRRILMLYEATQDWWPLSEDEKKAMPKAIRLAKCDLLTAVVQEFPELQGVMGGIYAKEQGLPELVSRAISEQYQPGFQGDQLPESREGQLLSLWDRVDTLIMAIAHGLKSTGSEDLFGLRRYALAIGRIAIEGSVMEGHRLIDLLHTARTLYGVPDGTADEAFELIKQRLESYLHAYPVEAVRSVLAVDAGNWSSLIDRLDFLQDVKALPQWPEFTALYKRLRRLTESIVPDESEIGSTDMEQQLAQKISAIEAIPLDDRSRWWETALSMVSTANEFFDKVLVMDPDETIRRQRLALLARGRDALSRYFVPS